MKEEMVQKCIGLVMGVTEVGIEERVEMRGVTEGEGCSANINGNSLENVLEVLGNLLFDNFENKRLFAGHGLPSGVPKVDSQSSLGAPKNKLEETVDKSAG